MHLEANYIPEETRLPNVIKALSQLPVFIHILTCIQSVWCWDIQGIPHSRSQAHLGDGVVSAKAFNYSHWKSMLILLYLAPTGIDCWSLFAYSISMHTWVASIWTLTLFVPNSPLWARQDLKLNNYIKGLILSEIKERFISSPSFIFCHYARDLGRHSIYS